MYPRNFLGTGYRTAPRQHEHNTEEKRAEYRGVRGLWSVLLMVRSQILHQPRSLRTHGRSPMGPPTGDGTKVTRGDDQGSESRTSAAFVKAPPPFESRVETC